MTISPKGFWHLSLPQNLFLGGVPHQQTLPINLNEHGSFRGCVQKVCRLNHMTSFVIFHPKPNFLPRSPSLQMEINGRAMSLMSDAIGGSNIDDCPHACTSKPCGSLAKCMPKFDNFECVCSRINSDCSQSIINSSMATQSASQIEIPTITITTAQQAASLTTTSKTTTQTAANSVSINSIVFDESMPAQPNRESPSLNNKIEVSVMVPPMDSIEHDFVPHDYERHSPRQHSKINSNRKHSPLKHRSKYAKRRNGVCFSGDESYFHYHDEETKRHIINYNVDLNIRMKTYSANGVILWAGPHTGHGDGDYLMLGIENG